MSKNKYHTLGDNFAVKLLKLHFFSQEEHFDKEVFCIWSLVFWHFEQNGFSSTSFLQGSRNCIPCVQMNILGKILRFTETFLALSKTSTKYEPRKFRLWRKVIARVVKIAFDVSKWTARGKIFPKNMQTYKMFRPWAKKNFRNLSEKKLARISKLDYTCPDDHLGMNVIWNKHITLLQSEH